MHLPKFSKFIVSVSLSLLLCNISFAAIQDVTGISDKAVGDDFPISDFNSVINTIKSFFRDDTNGNIGIGTSSPSTALDVEGTVTATEFVGGGAGLTGLSSGGKFVDGADTNDAVYTTGNVGIGTTSPSDTLTIEGGNFNHIASDPTTAGNWDPNDVNVMDLASSVYIEGRYAYVTGSVSDNMAIVDISNPTSPITVGNWEPNDTNIMDGAFSIRVNGKYAYIAGAASDNMAIVNVSNPTSPTTVGNWDPNDVNVMDYPKSLYIKGKYAYMIGHNSKNLVIIDISNPANPTIVGNWIPNDLNIMNGAGNVYVDGNYAYVSGSDADNLVIVDISDPTSPTTVGNWDPNDPNIMDGSNSVYVSGKYAYVTGYTSSNMAIVDVSNPASPVTAGNWDPNDTNIVNNAESVYVSGKYAFVGGGASNLVVVDVSNPTTPVIAGNWDPNDLNIINRSASVYVSGKYAYVGGFYSDNLAIVDISGIDAPSATIGDLAVGTIDIWENASVANDLYIGGSVNANGAYFSDNVGIYSTSPGKSALTINQGGTGDILNLFDGSSEVVTVIDGGNVGIGTSTPNQLLTIEDSISLKEIASANLDTAAYGQLWIKNDTPNTIWFTDDTGVDSQLGIGASVINELGDAIYDGSSLFLGNGAGTIDDGANVNVFVGKDAGAANTSGSWNTFVGAEAGLSNTGGWQNSFFGSDAGYRNTTGVDNTFIGHVAGFDNLGGNKNAYVGAFAGSSGTSGSQNSFFGHSAGSVNTTGSNNIAIGFQAGDNLTTGSTNIVIGHDIDTPAVDSANTMTIGNLIFGTGIDGTGTTVSTGNIGIGITSPQSKLHIDTGVTTEEGLIVKGVASQSANLTEWQDSAGTALTVVDENGNVGIGTSTPSAKLAVMGLGTGTGTVLQVADSNNTPNFTILDNGDVGIGKTTPSSTLDIDEGTGYGQVTVDGSTGGCLMLRDTDDAGWTECSVLDGTMSCSIDADGICDGS
ncbi:MAG: hypothetical protein OEL89_01755 [Candidatus Peregrinibacteria bacterium]|nr:hypothetical protein [Candidatus Peregrinibacteria bacterium]